MDLRAESWDRGKEMQAEKHEEELDHRGWKKTARTERGLEMRNKLWGERFKELLGWQRQISHDLTPYIFSIHLPCLVVAHILKVHTPSSQRRLSCKMY